VNVENSLKQKESKNFLSLKQRRINRILLKQINNIINILRVTNNVLSNAPLPWREWEEINILNSSSYLPSGLKYKNNMLQILAINKIVLHIVQLFSYWNYLIIKHQIHPSLCISNYKPYSHDTLMKGLESKWLKIIIELQLLDYKYINGIYNEGESELAIINQIKNYELLKLELRWYICFLKDIKQINILY
jgi:hypothetical protein